MTGPNSTLGVAATRSCTHALDVDAMNEAADLLVGQHDFASFCRKRKGATTIRTLLNVAWSRPAPHLAELEITADAFCH